MATKPRSKARTAVQAAVLAALLGASGFLTVELQKRQEATDPKSADVASLADPSESASSASDNRYTYERLADPARTVVRDSEGSVLATLTDKARTAVLTGPTRTFAEPRTTEAVVRTDSWVRLLPEPWTKGAEKSSWFRDWFKEYLGSKEPDVFAMAMSYGDKAPAKKDQQGIRVAGDASFGPINPEGSSGNDLRLEQSDFFDYLGIPYTFRDGTTIANETARYGAVDCSGYMRLVWGYRARYPLLATDREGDGLPRTANGMARLGPGVPVIPFTGSRPASIDPLQPGDLVFFEIDARTGARLDHVGMYLGLDTDGHPRYLSSREEADGPTFGDEGGSARLDGNGFYAKGLRSAKRL